MNIVIRRSVVREVQTFAHENGFNLGSAGSGRSQSLDGFEQ